MPTTPRFRRTRRIIAALLIGTIATTAAATLALTLARNPTLRAVTASTAPSTSAALLTVTNSGSADTWTSGSPTPEATEPPSGNEHFRIGSITKTFVHTRPAADRSFPARAVLRTGH